MLNFGFKFLVLPDFLVDSVLDLQNLVKIFLCSDFQLDWSTKRKASMKLESKMCVRLCGFMHI